MKKPVPNKIDPAFDDRTVEPARASRPERKGDSKSKPPKVIYKRCRQAIVESMAQRLAEDNVDEPNVSLDAADSLPGRHDLQHRLGQPQQQQQAEDHTAINDALRTQAAGLLTLGWAGLRDKNMKHKKVLDS